MYVIFLKTYLCWSCYIQKSIYFSLLNQEIWRLKNRLERKKHIFWHFCPFWKWFFWHMPGRSHQFYFLLRRSYHWLIYLQNMKFQKNCPLFHFLGQISTVFLLKFCGTYFEGLVREGKMQKMSPKSFPS